MTESFLDSEELHKAITISVLKGVMAANFGPLKIVNVEVNGTKGCELDLKGEHVDRIWRALCETLIINLKAES